MKKSFLIILLWCVGNFTILYAIPKFSDSWEFLNTTAIGAKQFIEKNPCADGRGVIIFILDSGIDVGVPGLRFTSTGKIKVIDVRDFSGEGDVSLYSAETGGDNNEFFVEHPDGFRLYGYDKLPMKPDNDRYWIGYLDERRFRHTKVPDINNNGFEDDQFGVLAFEVAEADSFVWKIFIDTDGDRQIDDEKPIHEYRKKHEFFAFRGGDKRFDKRPLNFAVNIDTYAMRLNFHFDSEGHGTHVAGIAAGYNIYNQSGFNGIAPGAQIISLKIGNGTLPGGSTTTSSVLRAVEFIENFLQNYNKPVIVNLSYGIGSVKAGESDFSNLFHQLVEDHRNVFVCASNGNDGPGIGTTGCPADDPYVFSVGAFLPQRAANEILGMKLNHDEIYYFSSRGGKLNKPDAVAPGFSVSTVPKFDSGDLSRGTSMAAPQIAGAAALMISAIGDSSLKNRITGLMIKSSLRQSAMLLPHFSQIDQGNGVVNVFRAHKILLARLKHQKKNEPISFEVLSESIFPNSNFVDAAFWRSGGFFPSDAGKATFRIYPIFPDTVTANERADFFQKYKLRCTAGWIKPEKKVIYFHGDKGAEISVKYDKKFLTKPGVYAGKILGVRRAGNSELIDFELLNVVVVPYHFSYENNYARQFADIRLEPGELRRFFIKTPPGATDLNISFEIINRKSTRCHLFCYDPSGFRYDAIFGVSSLDSRSKEIHVTRENLISGIWEIDIFSDPFNENSAKVKLKISFAGIDSKPDVITKFNHVLGKDPAGYFVVRNEFDNPIYGFALGQLTGYQRERDHVVQNVDYYDYQFEIKEDVQKAKFFIELPVDDFLKLSDLNLIITDSEQRIVSSKALAYFKGSITFFPETNEMYNLRVKGAFVHGNAIGKWSFKLIEQYEFSEPIKLKVYSDQQRLFWLYSDIENEMRFYISSVPRMVPDGFRISGKIDFYKRDKVEKVFSIPVLLNEY